MLPTPPRPLRDRWPALLALAVMSLGCAIGIDNRPEAGRRRDSGFFVDDMVDDEEFPPEDAPPEDAAWEDDVEFPPEDAPPEDAGGACGAGTCTPGETRACGACGTETCTDECTWGPCTGEGTCMPGATRQSSCDPCSHQVCTASCTWSACRLRAGNACEYRMGTNARNCGACRCGRQWCLSSCQWSTACTSCCTTCGGCTPP